MLYISLVAIITFTRVVLGSKVADIDRIFDYSLQELAKYSYLNTDSNCVQSALANILHQCKEYGVESLSLEDRKYSALQLTMCEMTNLNMAIPQECHRMYHTNDYDNCIRAMEKIPQYWTTFSGNFREIRKICFEESLPYEKDQILKLYTNITKVFYTINKNLSASYQGSEATQILIQEKFDSFMNQITIVTSELINNQRDMMHDLKYTTSDLQHNLINSLNLLKSFKFNAETDIHEIAVNLNFLNLEISQISKSILDVNIDESLTSLKYAIDDQCEEILDHVSEVVDDVKSKFDGMDKLMEKREAKEKELLQNLVKNNDMSSKLNEILSNIESKVLQQHDSLQFNTDYISNFLNDLFGELDDAFSQVEGTVYDSLDKLEVKISKTLKMTDQANEKLEHLIKYFDVATLIVKSIKTWYGNCAEVFSSIISYVFNSVESLIYSTDKLIRLLIILPCMPIAYNLICLVTKRIISSHPGTKSRTKRSKN